MSQWRAGNIISDAIFFNGGTWADNDVAYFLQTKNPNCVTAPDGTWSKIGATHGESIERMGDPRLLLTSYVVWALADSGVNPNEADAVTPADVHQAARRTLDPGRATLIVAGPYAGALA